jgi:TolB-like protein/Tfp pilus assembly protein PilF
LVTREEIQKELWRNETFVDFQTAVNQLIRQIRLALNDDAGVPRYVETVTRRGYRFIGEITVPSEAPPLPEQNHATDLAGDERAPSSFPESVQRTEATSVATRKPPSQLLQRATVIVVSLVLVAAVLTLVWRYTGSRLWTRFTAPPIHSLAVLPLENLSGDASQDYLADGMTDELITSLSKIRSLRVTSRTSVRHYKGTRKTVAEIARELQVDAVVEGSVSRVGDQVRIRTQLIGTRHDEHLWAESYTSNMQDVLHVQAEMAEEIAGQIRIRLTSQERAAIARTSLSTVPEANEAYLKGRYFFNQFTPEGFTKSCAYFEQATKADPAYALGYLGLADCYTIQSQMGSMPAEKVMPLAKAMAKKALEIDDTLADAHNVLGTILLHYDWDWPAAYRELQKAVELDPNNADAHSRLSRYYEVVGKVDDAVRESKFAQRLDPISERTCIGLGWIYVDAGRYDDAETELQQCLELNPDSAYAHFGLYRVYDHKKMYSQAIAQMQVVAKLGVWNDVAQNLEKTYRDSGYDQAKKYFLVSELKVDLEAKTDPVLLAVNYVALGEKGKALDSLELAYKEHSTALTQLKVNSALDDIRSEPRFQKILKDMNLAE